MARNATALDGGLNIPETLRLLQTEWTTQHGEAELCTVMDARVRQLGMDPTRRSLGKDSASVALAAIRGCRTLGLGVALVHVNKWQQHHVPLITLATEIRKGHELLARKEKRHRLRPELRPEIECEYLALSERCAPIHDSWPAMMELFRDARPRALLAARVVRVLDNGGFTWPEIADLVHDNNVRDGRDRRLRDVLRHSNDQGHYMLNVGRERGAWVRQLVNSVNRP